ncbi:MAG: hypothetical protein ACOZIN_22805 [Myxococcota bacterium]
MLAALFLTVLAAGAEAPFATAEELSVPVRIQGNFVMPDPVYLAVLQLPKGATADAQTAATVQEQLTRFLKRSGYELANVSALARDGGIEVHLDEGRLEKIVFRGRLTLQNVRFKLALAVPHEVFNRPALEREVKELAAKVGLQKVWFELVPTAAVSHVGPQLEDLGTVRGHALVHPRQPFELHVFFDESEWNVGPGVDIRAGYFDGLELGLNYQDKHLLLTDDRWRAAFSAGVGLRNRIPDDAYYLAFSRAAGELVWYAPPILATRPFVWVRAEGTGRQRKDLGLENYLNFAADASLNLQWKLGPRHTFSLGGGMQHRGLSGFALAPGVEPVPGLVDTERLRSFALLRADGVFDDGGERWDRRHELTLEGRHFFAIRDPVYGEGRLSYQKVFGFGWHDLWLKAKGTWLWGEVLFHNEEPVAGLHLRGVFGERYVRRVASGSAEFRFSLTRDLYKLSLFHDLAVWGEVDRVTGAELLSVGNSFGPGFHALIEGMFQLDLYLAFGFASGRRRDIGVTAILQKVF